MGICCEPGQVDDGLTVRDLAPPSVEGISDKYTVWEYGTPFKRCSYLAFKNALNEAHAADGGEGFVSMRTLSDKFATPAWAALDDESSAISKALLSDAFKNAKMGQKADQIDYETLMMFGLLHCQDRSHPMEKAKGFYELLQEGGFERHQTISASDKDLAPAFAKMCKLVTTDVFNFSTVKCKYDEDERISLEEASEPVLEDQLLDALYGFSSTLQNEVWLEKITKEGKWVFDATQLRAKLFESAQVATKHIK